MRPPELGGPAEIEATAALEEGRVIGGKYRIEKVIGQGGMGVVHAARHIERDELVAIKVLRPVMMSLPGMVARFLREGRAARAIESEHVARVSEVDTLPSGVPYMVMEHLDGTDLAALRRAQGQIPIADAAGYIAQACDGIAEAHALGIVHRDLKPANLFLAQREGRASTIKVLDFGISKVDGPGEQDMTKPGMTMGSPKYVSPEQMKSMHDADDRSDIWALGAILYELLAGRPAFLADDIREVCALVLHADPPPLRSFRPDVPPELEAIVTRCLRKQPQQRFASAIDLAGALSPFASSSLKPRARPRAPGTAPPSRVRALLVAALAVVIALGIAALVLAR